MKKIFLKGFFLLFVLLSFSFQVFAASEKRIDWNGRLEGEEEVPSWLRTLRRGNALAYCQEFGLNSKINREWLVPVGVESYIGWDAQRMNIQQQFVNQQIDSLNRTQAMAEANQRNQDDLANRNATNLYNQQTMHQSNLNQIDNRNIDTNQQQIQGTTQQLESRDRADVSMAQANAQSNATQAVAESGAAAGVAGQFGSNANLPGSDSNPTGPGMNDPVSMLMSL